MANEEHLEILKRGSDVWKNWRAEHLFNRPDLRGADLSRESLWSVNLSDADLRGANLRRTYLLGARINPEQLRALAVAQGIKISEEE